MKKPKKSKRGGPRPNSGAKPKDPAAGNRVMLSVRVHPDTVATLAKESTDTLSQGVIVDQAVALWLQERHI